MIMSGRDARAPEGSGKVKGACRLGSGPVLPGPQIEGSLRGWRRSMIGAYPESAAGTGCPAWGGRPGPLANRDDREAVHVFLFGSIRCDTISSGQGPPRTRLCRRPGEGNGRSDIAGGGEQSLQLRRVRASSPTQAIEAAQAFARALAASFNAAGRGQLDTEVGQACFPMSNATSDAVEKLAMIAALVLGLFTAFFARRAWRQCRSRQYQAAALGRPCGYGGLLLPVAPIVLPGWLLRGGVRHDDPDHHRRHHRLQDGRGAAGRRWPSARAASCGCKMRKVDSKRRDGARRVGNVPDIRYIYTVDGVEYRGKRIGIGEIQAGQSRAWRPRSNATGSAAPGRSTTILTSPRRPCWSAIRRPARGRCTPLPAG